MNGKRNLSEDDGRMAGGRPDGDGRTGGDGGIDGRRRPDGDGWIDGDGRPDGDEWTGGDGRLAEWEGRFAGWLRAHHDSRDGSHDLGHFSRVWKRSAHINKVEGGIADELVLLAAAYFHDLVTLPKNHPERSRSSLLSAEKTSALLAADFPDFPMEKIASVAHAIHAHSFSAAVPAETMEAKILQDADRMEALGAIGVARVFYTSGQLQQGMFDAEDPMAERRALDDRRYALDHFEVKLFRLPAMMNTVSGRAMAERDAEWMRGFVEKMRKEIEGDQTNV